MHDAWNDRLSDYLDGELTAHDHAALEAHLDACIRCREDLAALRAVVARARMLRVEPPAAELWPGIESRLEPAPASAPLRHEARRFTFTLPQLVAAGLALMTLSGGMVWLARQGGHRTDFPPLAAETEHVRPANFADRAYDEAVADLQQTLDAGQGRLDGQTLRVLDENLKTIDRAIAQCREALAADPANVYLNTYLAEARGRKLDLLRRAAAIVDKAGPENRTRGRP